jgi:DHA2 family methylenomycin A resistance protein-like MFS transporter
VGIAILSGTVPHTQYELIAVGLALLGLASTVAFSALTSLLLANVSPSHVGLASGMQNTTRQTGALMAVSILGAALNAHAIGTRLSLAFGVLAAAAVVAVIVSSLSLVPSGGSQINPVEQSDRALP